VVVAAEGREGVVSSVCCGSGAIGIEVASLGWEAGLAWTVAVVLEVVAGVAVVVVGAVGGVAGEVTGCRGGIGGSGTGLAGLGFCWWY